ncbi:MAG: hypothetical protein ABIA04_01015 [Pseudomonadota bacterium]
MNSKIERTHTFPKFLVSLALMIVSCLYAIFHYNAKYETFYNYDSSLHFSGFLNETYFYSEWMLIVVFIGALMGLLSIQKQQLDGSILFILSKPISRARILLARVFVSFYFLFLVYLITGAFILGISKYLAYSYPIEELALQLARLFSISVLFWSISIFFVCNFKRALLSFLASACLALILFFLNFYFPGETLLTYLPFHHLTNIKTVVTGTYPFFIMLLWFIASIIFIYFSVLAFYRKEY